MVARIDETNVKPVAAPAPPDAMSAAAEVVTSASVLARISWGAVFAGAAVASVLAMMLNLLGLAIGLAAFEPVAEQATAFGVGSVIWILATSIVALYAGGWVAGWAAGTPRRFDRGVHGVVAWGVATLFGVFLLASGVTRVVSGTASVLGEVAGAALPAAGEIAERVDLPPGVVQELEGLGQEVKDDPALRESVRGVLTGDASPDERERVVQELASRTGMSPDEANQRLIAWEQRAHELRYRAASKAEGAASAASGVAFLGVVAMFLGLGASTLGACKANPTRGDRSAS